MGADNMMAAKFRLKDRNCQLKKFFELVFDEDLDDLTEKGQLPDHPWMEQWNDIYRLSDFISLYSKKDLNECRAEDMIRKDCVFSLIVVEPDVYDFILTYSGRPTSTSIEELLSLFQPYLHEEQPCNHIGHYACDFDSYNVAYVLQEGKIYICGPVGNRELNREFISLVNNPDSDVKWGDPLERWDKSQEPEFDGSWWSMNDDIRYFDFSKLKNELSVSKKWEILE